jgi:hypothetical protein
MKEIRATSTNPFLVEAYYISLSNIGPPRRFGAGPPSKTQTGEQQTTTNELVEHHACGLSITGVLNSPQSQKTEETLTAQQK